MKNKQIKELLNQAISKQVPPLLDSTREVPITQKEVFKMNTNTKNRFNLKKYAMFATAAAVACCFTFFIITSNKNEENIRLSLDINPSIELSLNSKEEVIDVIAKNEDAKKIIDGMDLKNVKSEVALNAIIGSLYKNGYLNDTDKNNDMLLSVSNKDKSKAAELETKYVMMLKGMLNEKKASGKILAQKDEVSKEMEELATKYNISEGKAILISKIMAKSNKLTLEQLANMNIKELVAFMNENKLKIDDVEYEDTDDLDDILEDLADEEEDAKEDAEDDAQDAAEDAQEAKEDALEAEEEAKEDAQDAAKEAADKEADKLKEAAEKAEEAAEKEKEKLEKEKEAAAEASKDKKDSDDDN